MSKAKQRPVIVCTELVIARRIGESFVVGRTVVKVIGIERGRVKLGFEADEGADRVRIVRAEKRVKEIKGANLIPPESIEERA